MNVAENKWQIADTAEPLISFVIPFYNREDTLPRCINSILDNPCVACEIILVDDASTDNSEMICKKYTDRYRHVKYFKIEKNKGPGNARNMGIAASIGKYLFFLDSDDEINPSFLPRLAEIMSHEAPDFIYIRHLIVLPGGEIREKGPQIPEGNTSIEDFLEKYPDVPSGPAWICIYKSKFLRDNDIHFKQTYYYEDCCFLTSAFIKAKSFYMLPVFFCTHYSFHKNSLNTTTNLDRELEGFQHYFDLCNTLANTATSHSLTRSLDMCKTRLIINIMRNCTKPLFEETFATLEKQNISPNFPASYAFYKKYGVKNFLAQWLRNLYIELYANQTACNKRVYLCPVTDFSLAIGTVFANWSNGNIGFLDNNPSESNYYVRLCINKGFTVSDVKDVSRGDGKRILIYHKSYVVNQALSKQLEVASLKMPEDYISIYSS